MEIYFLYVDILYNVCRQFVYTGLRLHIGEDWEAVKGSSFNYYFAQMNYTPVSGIQR